MKPFLLLTFCAFAACNQSDPVNLSSVRTDALNNFPVSTILPVPNLQLKFNSTTGQVNLAWTACTNATAYHVQTVVRNMTPDTVTEYGITIYYGSDLALGPFRFDKYAGTSFRVRSILGDSASQWSKVRAVMGVKFQ